MNENESLLAEISAEFPLLLSQANAVDKDECERQIHRYYEAVGLTPPQRFVRFQSFPEALTGMYLLSSFLYDGRCPSSEGAELVNRFDAFMPSGSSVSHDYFDDFNASVRSLISERAMLEGDHVSKLLALPPGRQLMLNAMASAGLHTEIVPAVQAGLWNAYETINRLVLRFVCATIADTDDGALDEMLIGSLESIGNGLHVAGADWRSFIDRIPPKRATIRGLFAQLSGIMGTRIHNPLSAGMEAAWRVARLRGEKKDIQLLWMLAKSGAWWFPFEDVCCVWTGPIEYRVDNRYRLHRDDGAAVVFSPTLAMYCLEGVEVGESVVLNQFGAGDIDSATNLEVRRIMMQRFGLGEYLRQTLAEVVDRDNYGVLYRKTQPRRDEPLMVVEVTNSTRNSDGTYSTYFLRVPPTMRRAKEAVAWTFGLSEDDYHIDIES